MKSIFNLSALFFLLLLIPSTHAQIAIGEWRDHLPYSRTVRVAEVENMIYCATQYSIFVYDKDDQSVLRKSKVNGLSDVGISAMMYNKEYKTLVITYTNTNIDLIKEGKVINFSDIKRRQILGNKQSITSLSTIVLLIFLAVLALSFWILKMKNFLNRHILLDLKAVS